MANDLGGNHSLLLNNGNTMPVIGMGTYKIDDNILCEKCIYEAIKCGYRMFDTAAAYENEEAVGRAVKRAIIDGIVKREELFIITKLWIQDEGEKLTVIAAEESMRRMQLDYLDMYLIHQPFGDYYGAWRAMENMYKDGILKNIGVCNFSASKLTDLVINNTVSPMINQIEIHPFFHHDKEIEEMKKMEIIAQGWGPFSEGQRDVFNIKSLVDIGTKYGKSAAQVILRWHIQRKISVIPRAAQKAHMLENMDIWDFRLSSEDIMKIDKLDIGYSEIINHESACTAKWLNQWKIHD